MTSPYAIRLAETYVTQGCHLGEITQELKEYDIDKGVFHTGRHLCCIDRRNEFPFFCRLPSAPLSQNLHLSLVFTDV